jgi:protein-S-isoprenylcysteine O-methyltransferase Ste14
MGFYFSLWLALSGPLLLIAGILFSLLNLIYIILQDRWIFMEIFPDYGEYKKTTPFLIPNSRSLRRCVQTFR